MVNHCFTFAQIKQFIIDNRSDLKSIVITDHNDFLVDHDYFNEEPEETSCRKQFLYKLWQVVPSAYLDQGTIQFENGPLIQIRISTK